jgi:hypothetical protein
MGSPARKDPSRHSAFDVGDDGSQGVAVIGIAGHRLGVGDELGAPA